MNGKISDLATVQHWLVELSLEKYLILRSFINRDLPMRNLYVTMLSHHGIHLMVILPAGCFSGALHLISILVHSFPLVEFCTTSICEERKISKLNEITSNQLDGIRIRIRIPFVHTHSTAHL